MEDEEETHSHASPESHSHSPPSSRITVTVASAAPSSTPTPPPPNPPPPPHHNPLTLALPIQQPPSRPPSSGAGGSGGGGREDCWSEGATAVLIEAWGERYMELSRGNLKQKHWKEVADIVSSRDGYTKPPKTDIQCKNRIDTVKKKYKTEKAKVLSGSGPSRWPFFDRLDRLIGPSASVAKVTISTAGNAQKAVPVGIPVGVRPISLPQFFPHHLQPPPHLQPQQIRPHNFPIIPRFNPNTTTTNLNNSGRQQQQQQVGRGPPLPPESESEAEEEWSADSADSLPPDRKRPKVEVMSNSGGRTTKEKKGKREIREWGNSVRELTRAILKFGEAYEAAESAKLQQVMEMEKQRMKFAKELELQRIKFSMKTQLELSQLTTIADHNEDNNNHSDHSRGGGSSERREDGDVGGGVGEINNNNNHHHVNSDSSS